MVKEANPLGMRMKALTCMQRLAPRDFKSSAVTQQRCIVGHPPRDAAVDFQHLLYLTPTCQGYGGHAWCARRGVECTGAPENGTKRGTSSRPICSSRAGSATATRKGGQIPKGQYLGVDRSAEGFDRAWRLVIARSRHHAARDHRVLRAITACYVRRRRDRRGSSSQAGAGAGAGAGAAAAACSAAGVTHAAAAAVGSGDASGVWAPAAKGSLGALMA